MSNPESLQDPADPVPVFVALGDATRLELLRRMSDGQPRSIVQLAEGIDLTRQGVSKHLKVLEKAGIVASEKVGRENHFVFTPESIADVRSYLDRVSEQWVHAIKRLKAFVEDQPE